ncbi:peptidase C65 Otubain-domain-containing protein [Thelonectria olida]|uniref:ubiquitinyl hydrolase 1 n=1 Tax=Thelonectria olida TaxID=1576542 RepID=A0A9P8VRQ4_9HYPO|nr:peptidase C65 Otubain-domain-containing protein [Thelonectria olida]
MFQPQLTNPFAARSCASYGLAPDVDFGYSLSAGVGEASTSVAHNLQPPPPPQQQRAPLRLRQFSTSSAAAPSSFSTSSTSTTSPPPHTPTSTGAGTPVHQHLQHQLQLHQHQHQHQHRRQHQPRQSPQQAYRPSPRLVAPKTEEERGQHDMAAQQAAAKDFQIIHRGPKISLKVSSEAMTNEYAKADPIYVEKTIAIPQTYSHYRAVQGDGNCGWRAIGFSYFEKLIETGDQNLVEGEVARLMSFKTMVRRIGGYEYFDDWAEEMMGLLREIAGNMENSEVAHMLLMERWNDASLTASIIYYLRLLAATYLKANADRYDPFVPEGTGGVAIYCAQAIELVDREIEHLGIVALSSMLLEPLDFVLQIVYLDQSPGSQANIYRFPESANNQDPTNLGPIIYLLYHPDHYDILYRAPPPPPLPVSVPIPTAPVSMQVNRVDSFPHNTAITSTQANLGDFSSVNFGLLSMIPGLSMGGLGSLMPLPPSTFSQAQPLMPAPVQQSLWMPQLSERLSAPTPQPQPQPPVMASPQPQSPSTPISTSSGKGSTSSMVATYGLGSRASIAPALAPAQAVSKAASQASSNKSTSGYHIRFSPVQLEYEESKGSIEPHFNVKTNHSRIVYGTVHTMAAQTFIPKNGVPTTNTWTEELEASGSLRNSRRPNGVGESGRSTGQG